MAKDPLHPLKIEVQRLRKTVPPGAIGGPGSSGSPPGPTIGFGPGSATVPSIAFAGDPDTGFYNPTPNTVGLTLGAALSWTFSASAASGPGVLVAAGTAGLPSLSFSSDPNSGLYSAAAGTVGLAVSGAQVASFAAGGPVFQRLGGGSYAFQIQGEGTTALQVTRFTTNANGPQISGRKARGLSTAALAVLQNDVTFQQVGFGYGGTTFVACATVQYVVIEPTPSDTAMGGSFRIAVSPLGSISPSEVGRFEPATGFSMYGANPVIDQNRTVIFNSSTVAGLPTLVTAGNRFVTDLEGGQGTVYGGASLWRNAQNNQLARNTISGQGVLSKMTGYFNFNQRAVVNNTMQKLSDAGLLSKLLGLWVHAVPTNSTDALLNWITPGTRNAAIIGAPTWTANQGFTGDGSSALIDTAASLATFGATQNNVAVGCYVRTAGTGSAKAVIGCDNVAQARRMYLQTFTSGALVARCNDQTNDNYTPGQYTGMFVMSRSVSTGFNASVNDAAATTVTRASVTQTSSVAFLGTADSTGSEFSNAQIAFSFIATALTAADIANLRWILVDYYLVQMGAIAADYIVANLPLATTPPKGTRLNVTDGAAAPVFAAVPTGGGSLYLPVMTDGAAWHYG